MNTAAKTLATFLLLPGLAVAAGYGGAQGVNARGEIIHISGDMGETLYVQNGPGDTAWTEQYAIGDVCPSFNAALAEDTQFSCPADTPSPLAGATYRVTKSDTYRPCDIPPFNDPTPGVVYVCVEGCANSRAPALLHESPWEC